MAKLTGIGGVYFKSDDPERLSAWYEEHLGLRRNPDGAVVLPWRHANAPEKVAMTVWSIFPRDTDHFGPTETTSMVNDIVDDLDGMIEALRLAGARVELWEPPK